LEWRSISQPDKTLWSTHLPRVDIHRLACSPAGEVVVTGSSDRVIRTWDSETGQLLDELRGNAAQFDALDVSPDGRTIASIDDEGVLKLWHLASGQLLIDRRPDRRPASVSGACRFSPDGRWLAYSCSDDVIHLIQLH
jgi:WD40 repeat protein